MQIPTADPFWILYMLTLKFAAPLPDATSETDASDNNKLLNYKNLYKTSVPFVYEKCYPMGNSEMECSMSVSVQ